MRLSVLLALLALPCGAGTQPMPQPPRAPVLVHVVASGNDAVGLQLVAAVHARLHAVADMASAEGMADAHVRLKIATLDPDDGAGRRTVYSIVITVRPRERDADVYWNNLVDTCERANVQACARGIVAEAGAAADSLPANRAP